MERISSLKLRPMLLILMFAISNGLSAQTIFQDALHLGTLRTHYAAYCQALCGQSTAFTSKDRSELLGGKPLPIPNSDGPLRIEIKALLASIGADSTNQTYGSAATGPAKEAQIQKVAQEWALAESYLDLTKSGEKIDAGDLGSLSEIGTDFKYLGDISARISGNNNARSISSAGVFSDLLGMNQAEIAMDVVDWSLQQAKEELVKAFLGEFLDKIEKDSALILMFPNTLNMLRTTDLTTIFSNGPVWKAAFKRDLDGIPDEIPEIVALILRKLPAHVLDPSERREINGAVRIATDIYQDIGKGNSFQDVLTTLGSRCLLKAKGQLSVLEKGVLMSRVFHESVTTVENGNVSTVKTGVIAKLDSTQMADLWNLIFVTMKPELDQIFPGAKLDSLYHQVASKLPLLKYFLIQAADIFQSIQQITDGGTSDGNSKVSKTLNFQEVDRYFELSLRFLDNGIAMMDSFDILPAKDLAFYQEKVRPIAVDIMDGIQGVETQQYGMLITAVIDMAEHLNLKSKGLKNALVEGGALLEELKLDAMELAYSSDVSRDLTQIKLALIAFKTKHGAAFASTSSATEFVEMLNLALANLAKFRPNPSTAQAQSQKFANDLLNDLHKALKKLENEFADELGNSRLGQAVNSYGRLLVNLLTAKDKEAAEAVLNDFISGVGGYMVKQTSKSAVSLTLLPGVGGGYHFPKRATSQTSSIKGGIYGGASLPIGLEYSIGIKGSKLLGAIGIYGQAVDLGALLSYRITNNDTLIPQFTLQKVLSPGISVLFHGTKVPLVLGLSAAYSPPIQAVNANGTVAIAPAALRVGATLSVDVTAFQLWASKKKINPNYNSLGRVN